MADEKDEVPENPDPQFEPLVSLPEVEVKTEEEDEEEMFLMRSKLFRYDSTTEPPEWKERGLGDVKILKHKVHGTCRLVMRREKTFKVCANHKILEHMELKPNRGSDRAWVWSTPADYADEEPKPETLAIRFANAEIASKFKDQFYEAKKINTAAGADEKKENGTDKDSEENENSEAKDAESVTEKLEELSVKDEKKTEDGENSPKSDSDQAER